MPEPFPGPPGTRPSLWQRANSTCPDCLVAWYTPPMNERRCWSCDSLVDEGPLLKNRMVGGVGDIVDLYDAYP